MIFWTSAICCHRRKCSYSKIWKNVLSSLTRDMNQPTNVSAVELNTHFKHIVARSNFPLQTMSTQKCLQEVHTKNVFPFHLADQNLSALSSDVGFALWPKAYDLRAETPHTAETQTFFDLPTRRISCAKQSPKPKIHSADLNCVKCFLVLPNINFKLSSLSPRLHT